MHTHVHTCGDGLAQADHVAARAEGHGVDLAAPAPGLPSLGGLLDLVLGYGYVRV